MRFKGCMMNRKLIFSVLAFMFVAVEAHASPAKPLTLPAYQDSLRKVGNKLFTKKQIADKDRAALNRQFADLLEEAMNAPDAYAFNFDSLTFMARLRSSDNRFRIFNWNIVKEDGTYGYFGFIQVKDEKKNTTKLYKLQNKSAEIRGAENAILSPEKWYGVLYYKIIETTHKKKKYYTLLGWDGNNNVSWKKVIDVLYFRQDGTPQFGDPIFEKGKRNQHRVIFEYKAEMAMTLRWDTERDMLIYDFLQPEFEGMRNPPPQFLVSSGSYDGYRFRKGKWEYVDDVDARNKRDKKDSRYNRPN